MKVQCPYKITKYRCQYGQICVDDLKKSKNGMPSDWNECSVAQRQINGDPWKNERKVEWNKSNLSFEPKELNTIFESV